ncbi:MAG: hypothetical protein JNK60_20755 [Acidobacteria bacterium]|nr:hypothetical protein [Acidobacteriota bacterium]
MDERPGGLSTGGPRTARLLLAGVLWLAFVWIVAIASRDRLPWPDNPWTYDLERRVSPLTRWDSGWYVPLAERGYEKVPERQGQQTNHAFFPLYPLLVRVLTRATGLETSHAGNVVSGLAFLGLLPLFAAFVRSRFGAERVGPAVAVFLLFPTSFFFAAVYTESLVVLLSLGAVLLVEKDRPFASAALGFLAGLTRVSGLLLGPYLFLASLRRSRVANERPWPTALKALLAGVSPALGFGLFCLYFQRRFGDPLLFFRAQHNWAPEAKTTLDGPARVFRAVASDLATGAVWREPARTFEGLYVILFLVLVVLLLVRSRVFEASAWTREGAARNLVPEAVYVSLLLTAVLLSGWFESAGRYVLPAFPAFAVLGGLSRFRVAWPLWLAASAVAQAIYVFLFVNWIWAG